MLSAPLAAVPESHRHIARDALAVAFSRDIEDLRPVTGGASGALTYRIEAAGRPYLLRIETRPRGGLQDPQRAFVCMATAAEAGVAPALRHLDPEAGVAIMNFVTQRPLADYPGGQPALVRDAGRLARRLQQAPAFPPFISYIAAVERILHMVLAENHFAPGLLDPHLNGFRRIQEIYPWNQAELVSAHNAPNLGNLLFDGQRLWLVDWELSFRNDPFTDLAIMAENLAPTPDLVDTLLASALDRRASAHDHARLTLMRQLTRLFYASVMLTMTMPGRPPAAGLSGPTPAQLGAMVAEGKLAFGSPEGLYLLGRACLAGFLAGLEEPEFKDAMAVIHAG